MRQSLRLAGISLVVAVVWLQAGPQAQDRRQMQMAADLRMLQEQTQQLQTLLQTLTEAVKQIDARVTTRIDQQTDATRKAFADQKLGIDALTVDLRVLREKVDDAGVRIGSLTQEMDAVRQTVLALTAAPPAPAPVPGLDPAANPGPAGTPAPGLGLASPPSEIPTGASAPPPVRAPAAVIGSSPTRMYESAFADYAAGNLDVAILGFESFIKTFPTSENADDAQVNVCQSYVLMGQYEKAVQACDQAIRNYPNGDALPDAYYRKGLALRSLKRPGEARAAFEFIIKTYPTNPAANLSQQRLAEDNQRP